MSSPDKKDQKAVATGEENNDNDDGGDEDCVPVAINLTDNDTSVEVSVAAATTTTTTVNNDDQDGATTSNDSERMSNPGDLEALTGTTNNLKADSKSATSLSSAAAFAAEAAIAMALATSSSDDDDDDDDDSCSGEEGASLAKIHAAAFATKLDDTQDNARKPKLTNTNCASNVASQSASVASDNDNKMEESTKNHHKNHKKGQDNHNENDNDDENENDNDKEVATLGAAATGATLESYASPPSSSEMTVSDALPMTTLTRSVATRTANRAMSLPGAYHVAPSTFLWSSSSSVNVGVLEDDSNRGEQQPAATSSGSTLTSGTNDHSNNNDNSERVWHAELVTPSITVSITNSSNYSVSNNSHSRQDFTPEILPRQQQHPPAVLVVDGKVVSDEEDLLQQQKASRRFFLLSCLGILFLLSIIVALSLGLSGVFGNEQDSTTLPLDGDQGTSIRMNATTTKAPTTADANSPLSSSLSINKKSTLEMIKERGSLRAAISMGETDPETFFEHWSFYIDLLRAIAAGILGPDPQVEFVNVELKHLFETVANGTVDVMLFGATHTMERDVYMHSVMSSFSFSIPYFYSGLRLAGDPFYVNCIDSNFNHVGECLGLKVCVTADVTTHFKFVSQYMPERYIVPIPWSVGGIFQGLASGKCNVIAEEEHFLTAGITMTHLSSQYNYTGEYVIGQSYLSKEPHAAVSRNDDPEFSSFISVIFQGLLAAEYLNITQLTFDAMPQTAVFGEEYKDMLRHAVGTAGNFGQIYERGMKVWTPRSALNEINNGSTGLLYPHPFGAIENIRDETVSLGNTLTSILQRGKLRCGLRTDRPGFATRLDSTTNATTNSVGYAGMDVDYCRALSASLFRGDDTAVDFVEVEEANDGFVLLSNDAIDVLAGGTMSLQTMGHGYSCSQPYFYGYSSEEDNFCLATRQHDSDNDWADFVYWIVTASFYAEDNNVLAATSNDMPEVFVYGREMKRLFRDAILAVGNYAEMYERNVEGIIPRGGRNVLNSFTNIGPQHYIVPGIFEQTKIVV